MHFSLYLSFRIRYWSGRIKFIYISSFLVSLIRDQIKIFLFFCLAVLNVILLSIFFNNLRAMDLYKWKMTVPRHIISGIWVLILKYICVPMLRKLHDRENKLMTDIHLVIFFIKHWWILHKSINAVYVNCHR